MLLFVLLCLAAVQDIRSGKVANRLIAMGLLAGAVFQAAEHQAWGVYYFLRNVSVPIILFYLLFQMRVLGAGDIKLFSMIGSILTIGELYQCMACSFLVAGAGAAALLATDRNRWIRLRYAIQYLFEALRFGIKRPYEPPGGAGKLFFPFAVPILFGTAIACCIIG